MRDLTQLRRSNLQKNPTGFFWVAYQINDNAKSNSGCLKPNASLRDLTQLSRSNLQKKSDRIFLGSLSN
ncbi:MAG: hypothetical protein IJ881_05235 [Neisseriaceae bacterium]|nr:hypothetical protein [Neisseriaceae bacterium]